jgi:hypothetical protein
MHHHGSSNQPQSNKPNRGQTRFSLPIKIVLFASIGIITYFLITEHWVHLAGFLPYSFLLIFILMHLFMHGGHGGHGGHDGSNDGSGNDGSGDRKHQH